MIGGAGAVLADPPWSWESYSVAGDGRSACQHYEVMSLDDLEAYPVAEMAATDSWLFLWVVSSNAAARTRSDARVGLQVFVHRFRLD